MTFLCLVSKDQGIMMLTSLHAVYIHVGMQTFVTALCDLPLNGCATKVMLTVKFQGDSSNSLNLTIILTILLGGIFQGINFS